MEYELEQFYKQNFNMLCKTVAGRIGGMYNAEDVVQEAFARALTYQETFDVDKSELATWFSRILHRAMYDFKRQELRQGMARDSQDEEEPVYIYPVKENLTMQEIKWDIQKIKNPDHREVIWLTYVKHYRPREISEVMDITASNINLILNRFKREVVEKYGS